MGSRHRASVRRGAVTPLMALLLIFLMALLAFAVDLGYVTKVRAELQNTADAAALAGASQLLEQGLLKGPLYEQTAMSTMMSNARTEVVNYVHYNPAGGVTLAIDRNDDNLETGDIVCGYFAKPSDHNTSMVVTVPGVGPVPNSVQVRVRRDRTRNNPLSIFFGRALGIDGFELQATATATYEDGITGFRIPPGSSATSKLLPFALYVETWKDVVAGNGSDSYARDPVTGAVTSGQDGIPECKLYPLSNGSGGTSLPPGNFGTLDLGSANNSTADLCRQILSGPNATDFSYFTDSKIQLDPTTGTLSLQGDTGISAGVKEELAAIKGQSRILPLYSAVSGPGNNATYTIVGFAGVTILNVKLTGSLSSKSVTIQPCFAIDSTSLGGGSSTTSWFVTKPLALTR